jgi:hypothetical protein
VVDLEINSKCLLSKWLFNLINTDGAWQQLLRNNYLGGKSITQVSRKTGDSHFWSGLMNIKDQFLNLGSFKLQDGKQIRFWEDKWLGAHALRDEYPNLYNIVGGGMLQCRYLPFSPTEYFFQKKFGGQKFRVLE